MMQSELYMPVDKGQQFRDARRRLGLNQADLAEQMGIAQSTIARWESGGTPSEEYHQQIFDLLGVDYRGDKSKKWMNAVREDSDIPFYVRALMLEIRARAASDVTLVIMSSYLDDGVDKEDLEMALKTGQEKGLWKVEENQGEVILLRFATH